MTRKSFMQELITREQLVSGEVRLSVALTLARPMLAHLVHRELEEHAGYATEQQGRLMIFKSAGLEVVELSRTLELYPRDRQYVVSLATEERDFNYHASPKARVAVRAEFDTALSEREQRASAVGFVTAGEVLNLGSYIQEMHAMEIPQRLQAETTGRAE